MFKNSLFTTAWMLFFSICLAQTSVAQQEPLMNHYKYNRFIINPAVAGSMGYANVSFLTRQQWIGYEKYPGTFWLSGETRFLKRKYQLKEGVFGKVYRPKRNKSRTGLGGYFYNDRSGFITKTGLSAAYSFHTFINRMQLSFGLAGSFTQVGVNKNEIIVKDLDDRLMTQINRPYYIPDFHVGVFTRYNEYYLGFSARNLMESKIKLGGKSINLKAERHYHLMGGTTLFLNDNFAFDPSFMITTPETINFIADISCNVIIYRMLHTGFAYRTNGDGVFFLGVELSDKIMYKNLHISYTYDYPFFSEIQRQNIGSHELMVSFTLGSSTRRMRWKDWY